MISTKDEAQETAERILKVIAVIGEEKEMEYGQMLRGSFMMIAGSLATMMTKKEFDDMIQAVRRISTQYYSSQNVMYEILASCYNTEKSSCSTSPSSIAQTPA